MYNRAHKGNNDIILASDAQHMNNKWYIYSVAIPIIPDVN